MRFFNTAGPNKTDKHYCLPPLERLDPEETLALIDHEKYFVLHAPRQTGKTSCLLALMEHINLEGKYKCLYFNVESAQAAREDIKAGVTAILSEIGERAGMYLKDSFPKDNWAGILAKHGPNASLNTLISRWSEKSDKPLVLLIDEIDSLVGDTLISVLRQIRAGYDKRPKMFPQSIVFCGVRDVRDYRIHSKGKEIITGGSAFNIKSESLSLGNFSEKDVKKLYEQHTDETGQLFDPEAPEAAWSLTQGQPWLVNSLAYEACFKTKKNRDRSVVITGEMMEQAAENIIQRRETHLDQLVDKLREERVRRVIEPILAGVKKPELIPFDDLKYCEDLGLITTKGNIRISNRIYQEVIPRELTYSSQVTITNDSAWYVRENGTLDMKKLLSAFQEFFRENSEIWLERFKYKEAGPQLLLQAFMQRVLNGGGRIHREYGLGRMRTDLLIIWPYPAGKQKIVIELKIKHKSFDHTLAQGLEQTCLYMDKCSAAEAHLIIFDRGEQKSWEEKIFSRQESFKGKTINLWGM